MYRSKTQRAVWGGGPEGCVSGARRHGILLRSELPGQVCCSFSFKCNPERMGEAGDRLGGQPAWVHTPSVRHVIVDNHWICTGADVRLRS